MVSLTFPSLLAHLVINNDSRPCPHRRSSLLIVDGTKIDARGRRVREITSRRGRGVRYGGISHPRQEDTQDLEVYSGTVHPLATTCTTVPGKGVPPGTERSVNDHLLTARPLCLLARAPSTSAQPRKHTSPHPRPTPPGEKTLPPPEFPLPTERGDGMESLARGSLEILPLRRSRASEHALAESQTAEQLPEGGPPTHSYVPYTIGVVSGEGRLLGLPTLGRGGAALGVRAHRRINGEAVPLLIVAHVLLSPPPHSCPAIPHLLFNPPHCLQHLLTGQARRGIGQIAASSHKSQEVAEQGRRKIRSRTQNSRTSLNHPPWCNYRNSSSILS